MGALFGALVLGGLLWLWKEGGSYPTGEGPLDQLPAGTGSPAGSTDVTSTDGSRYGVRHWAPKGDDQLHVAERKGGGSWVSYWHNRATGARKFIAARAVNPTDLADLKKDFGLV